MNHLFLNRLTPVDIGAPPPFTPINKLLLCGSGAHPSRGVTGAPGHIAAQAAIALLGEMWRLVGWSFNTPEYKVFYSIILRIMKQNYVPLYYKEEILHTSLLFTLYIQYLICLEPLWKSNNKRIWDDVQYILLKNKTPSKNILQNLPLVAESFA